MGMVSIGCTVDSKAMGILQKFVGLWFCLTASDSEDLPEPMRGKPIWGQYHKFKTLSGRGTDKVGGLLRFNNATTDDMSSELVKDQPKLGDLSWLSLAS